MSVFRCRFKNLFDRLQNMIFLVQFTALCIMIAVRVAAQAPTDADFLMPPDWLAHGLGNSGGVGQGGSVEPINVVVSAQSDVDPFDVLTTIASFSSCFNSVSTLQANVQPGQTSPVDQDVGLRDGGCLQIFVGGNHLRGWTQLLPNGTTAFFIAASEEHICRSDGGQTGIPGNLPNWHCIDSDGFNQGRNTLTNDFVAAASTKNSGFAVMTKRVQLYQSGVGTDAGEGSAIDHIPYDGMVDVILLS